ncbi:hypothetical protein AVEN_106213-1 [Araneus ventricosus]|uniref:Uncharacterized protein n=1 Tax=Araneus ventricosus TaxID=182803 RepID=A0A4Y2JTC6_ARAVE|nr:hypothetical protein AVEN_106213-1 [Araneus ventricosus]
MTSFKVHLQCCEEIKSNGAISGLYIGCSKAFHWNRSCKSRVIKAVYGPALSCNNRTPFESCPVISLPNALCSGTIPGRIHGHSTRCKINRQQTLVAPKDCGHNFLREWHCFEFPMGKTKGVSIKLMFSSSQVSRVSPTFRSL